MIPANRLNPVSVDLINQYMPLPNVAGAANFAGVTTNIVNINQGIARIDHSFGARDQVFVHYIYSARDFPNTELNPNFFYNATFPNESLAAQHVHTFSPTLVNELRFGWHKGNIQKFSVAAEHGLSNRATRHHGTQSRRSRRARATAGRTGISGPEHRRFPGHG